MSISTARALYPLGWLRGLAALAVVTFHAYQWNRQPPSWQWPWSGTAHQLMLGTDLFVDMFFVLSGLLLWLPVVRAATDGETGPSGRAVLVRRMARLLPLYVLVVTLVWAISNPVLPGHWQDLVLHLTFTHIYSDQYVFWTDGPAWSLAVEFHFYVLVALSIPLVAAAARRIASPRRRLAVTAILPVLLIVATGLYLTWAGATHQDLANWSVWFSPLTRAADFGIGMLLAVVAVAGVRLGSAARGGLAVTGIGALIALVLTRPGDTLAGEMWHPAFALAIAVALASIVLHEGPWPRILTVEPLTSLGGLGYGIYLIHEPVMRYLGHLGLLPAKQSGWFFLVTALIVAVPAVALAWVSSKTVEAAGLRIAASIGRDGSEREYYPHLSEPDLAHDVEGERSPVPV
ncbi:MAG: acyltransferase [Nocardioides sp.]|uniref:acyltransferase family protein n=1 Tax=Nocardioides sp. TaxID=35761 RepID=UPI0039E36CBB